MYGKDDMQNRNARCKDNENCSLLAQATLRLDWGTSSRVAKSSESKFNRRDLNWWHSYTLLWQALPKNLSFYLYFNSELIFKSLDFFPLAVIFYFIAAIFEPACLQKVHGEKEEASGPLEYSLHLSLWNKVDRYVTSKQATLLVIYPNRCDSLERDLLWDRDYNCCNFPLLWQRMLPPQRQRLFAQPHKGSHRRWEL